MNWSKVLLAGVVAGVVKNLADWVMHGFIMGATYTRYPEVFTQEATSPIWFFVVAISVGIFFAILFAKTRECWADGIKGGMTYGFWVGMVAFFGNFYTAIVIDGFPYYLGWCWGGIGLIGAVIGGAVVGLIIKR